MQQRLSKRSCTTAVPTPAESVSAGKKPCAEEAPARRNKRSITTPSNVNINVVERKLFNLELERQHHRVRDLTKSKQNGSFIAENTDPDANRITQEQKQNTTVKEPTRKQPLSSRKKSPPRKNKSLKDLIYETNKTLYQVDSNKVKYKVGLSKKQLSSPKAENNQA
ncbi:hypothetical protein SEUBUCD646_0B01500 [Saccharomyces eubayanus]|uniref:Uncharacterized protein n=2 Tax=Saccharomyces TaxID=4930 RepID=A0A6C1E3A4_SACPS|nr:HED1-like protein [Saccharomyces eubayanus]KOH00874.1 HED1-like protein [Saccharomyces eubayanus]QID83363.1 hypothetical protein GRS66_005820 [Saccharomyces pastorianus]CAI1814285.1 hypothetical protein SEUBUCD650_0B01520 [Saccharomyces eubayanus]CAI1849757.1 hypothetical protein SEUBUCD646_0B01500 [Saccharomyces eubayanus]